MSRGGPAAPLAPQAAGPRVALSLQSGSDGHLQLFFGQHYSRRQTQSVVDDKIELLIAEFVRASADVIASKSSGWLPGAKPK